VVPFKDPALVITLVARIHSQSQRQTELAVLSIVGLNSCIFIFFCVSSCEYGSEEKVLWLHLVKIAAEVRAQSYMHMYIYAYAYVFYMYMYIYVYSYIYVSSYEYGREENVLWLHLMKIAAEVRDLYICICIVYHAPPPLADLEICA